ncbi:Metal dependent phosphohydrolase [Pseudomonas cichorii]|uniref:Metal dependent phosphohydrolase n=1 Tax=Pseudomonas cichorii TaxID=36746 RepID=A0A3M4LT45_PSECI|nr:HD-GYP domain-containing protein [Pseudomonas cichorii]RMQ44334.1 Metal dependent phosphohydrolase [Pseudomonas cichorii]
MLKHIPVTELRLGMYVHELCDLRADHSFWTSSFLLKHESDLQRIRSSSITRLWIDGSRGLDIQPANTPAITFRPGQSCALAEEIGYARELCIRSRAAVARIFSDVRMGRIAELEDMGDLIDDISDSLARHPDALLSLARLKTADEYTYMHSVAVGGLMIALARQLALPESLVKEAGLAGLLHDVGKLAIPANILNKPGKLSDEEFAIVRRHPAIGCELLGESRHFSPRVLDVCLHHHERFDGSGYPDRLAGSQISLFARMGAICDVYDAITSDRPYKACWSPAESISRMAEWTGHFDEKIFQAFVKCVGIYPVGSLVRLESGNLGIVMEQNKGSLLTPKVKVFYSALCKMPIAHTLIDLSCPDNQDRILNRECAKNWGFKDLDHLWTGLPESVAH